MTTTYNKVKEFHEVFGHAVNTTPTVGSWEARELRVKLIAEELTELCEALGVSLDIDISSGRYEVNAEAILSDHQVDLVKAADALGDIDYVTNGAYLEFGIPHEQVIAEIHESNMTKLGEDGKPIYNEDGKVQKGPNYRKPDLKPIILG